jgi:hypothetical protein
MSTETAEAVEPYRIAEHLSRAIFASLFPHDPENNEKRHGARRSDLAAELLVPPVEAAADVEVDDILVVVEDDAFGNALRTHTARDILMRTPRTHLVRVLAKSAKSLVVKWVDLPRGAWHVNLAEFGTPYQLHEPQRLMLSSASREVGRLGPVEELRQKLAAHPQFGEWQAAYTAAVAEQEARDAASKAERESKAARLVPVKEAVAGLNKIAGEPLVELTYSNSVIGVTRWLHANGFLRTQVYICGLNAVGRITDEQQVEALQHLDVIIAAAKESGK